MVFEGFMLANHCLSSGGSDSVLDFWLGFRSIRCHLVLEYQPGGLIGIRLESTR